VRSLANFDHGFGKTSIGKTRMFFHTIQAPIKNDRRTKVLRSLKESLPTSQIPLRSQRSALISTFVAICVEIFKMANTIRETGTRGEQWRVTIPASKKLPPVPNPPGLVPPSTAGGDSESSHREPKDSKILRYRLLACDQRSFLTGSRRVDMQAAYIINTVRKDDQRKANVVSATDSSRTFTLTETRKSFLHNSVFIIRTSRPLNWIASSTVFFVE
jgi:hypothetical protein